MRIGIDGFNLAMAHGTGVATYGYSLAGAAHGLGHDIDGLFGLAVGADPALREIRFYDALGGNAAAKDPPLPLRLLGGARRLVSGMRVGEVKASPLVEKRIFAEKLPAFDRILTAGRLFENAERMFRITGRFLTLHMDNPPDVMHWTYPLPVRLAGSRNVYTLHDLVPLKLPYATLDVKRLYYRLVRQCLRQADHILTVSESSRRDIEAMFGAPACGISNCYQSAPLPPGFEQASPAEDAAAIEGIFGLRHQGYFLFFGSIEPKKNIGRLIEAHLSLSTETPLVIVGSRGWRSEEELKLIQSGGGSAFGKRLAQRIIRLDYLPRTLLMRLIRGARAVAFPSLYEGFGLPVLEAMQLGTPVLTSDGSSLPEVAGAAALCVDPYDIGAIASGLTALDEDPDLRIRLSAAGLEQARNFSTAAYQDRLAAMYGRLAARG